MNKKKIIKIVGIISAIIVIVFLFMFRVVIHNSIQMSKLKSIVKSSYEKPDYQIKFANNVEEHAKGNGYSYNSDLLLILLDEKKIIYSNEINKKEKVSFVLGDEEYYLKIKIIDLDDDLLEMIKKYEHDKFLLTPEKHFNLTSINVGDIKLSRIKYNGNNIQDIKDYFIPKSNNTELYQILERVNN